MNFLKKIKGVFLFLCYGWIIWVWKWQKSHTNNLRRRWKIRVKKARRLTNQIWKVWKDRKMRRKVSFEWKSLVAMTFAYLAVGVGLYLIPIADPDHPGLRAWKIWAIAYFTHLLLSLRQVGSTDIGLITLFGKPKQDISSGLHFVLRGFCELVTITRNISQEERPAEPELVWDKRDENQNALPLPIPNDQGYVLPIRINFSGEDPATDKDIVRPGGVPVTHKKVPGSRDTDPLRRRLTVTASFTWSFVCSNLGKFIEAFGLPDEARKVLSDMVVIEMTNVLQKGTLARAMSNADIINENVLRSLLKNILEMKTGVCPATDDINTLNDGMDRYIGIRILKVQFKPFGLSHDLNRAISKAAEMVATKNGAITESEGQRQARINLAAGTKAELQAVTEAMAERAKIAGTPSGLRVLALNTLENTVGGRDKIIFTGGGGNGDILQSLTSALITADEARRQEPAGSTQPEPVTPAEGGKKSRKKKGEPPQSTQPALPPPTNP